MIELLLPAIVLAVLVGLAGAYVGRPPAEVRVDDDVVRVRLRGTWPVLALRRSLTIPRAHVRAASAVADARPMLEGFRVGTYVPGGPIAGVFTTRDRRAFWAVRRRAALVLDLTGEGLDRVVVETDDPAGIVDALALTGTALAHGPGSVGATDPSRAGSQAAVAIVVGVLGALGLAVAAIVAAPHLPSPVASHWDLGGEPNGHQPLAVVTVLIGVVWVLGLVPLVASRRERPGAEALAGAVFTAAIGTVAFAAILASNWGARDWRDATQPSWTVLVLLGVPLAAAAVTLVVARRSR